MCFHGGRDPFVSDSDLLAFKREMDAKSVDYEVVVFGPCLHAFTRPDKTSPSDKAAGFFYDPNATRRSWDSTQRFLAEALRRSQGVTRNNE
jgi:dienelactone hydrolase